MGKTIIKPDRSDDFYVEWSSIVEAPTAWGTRAEMLEYMSEQHERAEDRMARVDSRGTSALWPSRAEPAYAFEDDDGLIYQQIGWIRRADLKALCKRLEKDEDADVSDLLEPFEDEDD